MINQKFKTGTIVDVGYEEYQGKNTFYLVLKNNKDETTTLRGKGLEEAYNRTNGLKTGDIINLKDFGIDENTKKRKWEIEHHESYQDLQNSIEVDNDHNQDKFRATKFINKTKDDFVNVEKNKLKIDDEHEQDLPLSIKNNYVAIIKNRFLQDEKINYYDKSDKDNINIAFEDRRSSLNTSRQDEKTIQAMLDLAESKGWSSIKLKGTEEFRQKVWLEASLRGIKIKGYEPTEKDKAELIAKQSVRIINQVEKTPKLPELNREIEKDSRKSTIYEYLQKPINNQAYLDKIGVDFEGAKLERIALNFNEAREQAKKFTGKQLTNFQSGIQAIISNKNLEKMLSGKAHNKSVSKEIHLAAVANADKLFENSVFAWQSSYKNESPDIEAIHRTIAPIKIDEKIYLAKLTVKEMTKEQGNRVYSVETIEIDNEKSPVPEMTEEDTKKYSVTPHRLNEALVNIIVQKSQEYNKNHENIQKIDIEQNNQPKTATELKRQIIDIVQNGHKDGSIANRDDLVAKLKAKGFEVMRESEKSITLKNPNPNEKNIRLNNEIFTKDYNVLKELKANLEPERLKANYPNISEDSISKVKIWKENVLSRFETPQAQQNALYRLNNVLPDVVSGKLDLGYPKIPANEIKPDIEVRTPDNGDQSRSR